MRKVRKVVLILFCIFLVLSISVFVVSQCIFQTVKTPGVLERAIASSGVYSIVVPDEINLHSNDVIVGNIYVSTPWLKQDLRKTFTPSLVESDTNTVINGVYPWLTGRATAPSFSISLNQQQTQIENDVVDNIQNKLDQLPNCSISYLLSHLQLNSDPFNLTCIPSFISRNLLETDLKQQVGDISFIDTTFNENNLKLNGSQTIAQQFSNIPRKYQELNTVRYISALISIILCLIIIFTHASKKKGIELVVASIFGAGIVCFLSSYSNHHVEKLLTTRLNNEVVGSLPLQPYIKSVVNEMANSVSVNIRTSGELMIVIGFVVWIIFRFLLKEKPTKVVVVTNPN